MKPALTLLESLIALAVVAVLAGVAYPLTSAAIARSREAACLGNLRSLGTGLHSYLQDHQQTMPVWRAARTDRSDQDEPPTLETGLADYLDSPAAFHCPADAVQFARSGSSYLWNSTQNGLHVSKLAFFGIADRTNAIPLISDKESWHPHGTNFLYADASSSREARFATNR
jgi:prepilin-type N-terminal cleavage/methylation domain-containing protein